MKCDELESYYYYEDRVFTPATHTYRVYHADEVDEAIAELKDKLQLDEDEMAGFLQLEEECGGGDLRNYIAELKAENERLKAKLESVQASAYADSVDAGMRERRLKRALWLARVERAKEHIWHEVNTDGSPKCDYEGHDWVLVQLHEFGGFELIPRIAEYRRNLQKWVFIDEDYDTENTHTFRYIRGQCEVIGWRPIDFAYYGKKFFVQQEINKNVERKCLKKAEEYK